MQTNGMAEEMLWKKSIPPMKERGLNLHVVFPYGKNHLKADVLPIGTKRAPLAVPQAPHLLFYSKEYL